MDLSSCRFEPDGERSVRVSGARFIEDPVYRVKLEGAGLFDDEPAFLAVVAADVINPDNVAALFGVDRAQVSSIHVLPEGLAIKLTLLRPRPQCSAGETDVYGCQQHVPLMTLPVPLEGNSSPPTDSAAVQS